MYRCLTCGSVWPRKQIPHHDDRNAEDPEQNCPIERGWGAVFTSETCSFCGGPIGAGTPFDCIRHLAAQNAEFDKRIGDLAYLLGGKDKDLASLRERVERLEKRTESDVPEQLAALEEECDTRYNDLSKRIAALEKRVYGQGDPPPPPLTRRMKGNPSPHLGSAYHHHEEHDWMPDCGVPPRCEPVTPPEKASPITPLPGENRAMRIPYDIFTPPEKAYVDLRDDEAELVAAMCGEPNTPPEKAEERCAFGGDASHLACGGPRNSSLHWAPNWRTPPDMLGHPFVKATGENDEYDDRECHVMDHEALTNYRKLFADTATGSAPEPRESGKREHRWRPEDWKEIPWRWSKWVPCPPTRKHLPDFDYEHRPAQRSEIDGRSGVQSDASGTASPAGATPASSLSTPAADAKKPCGVEVGRSCSHDVPVIGDPPRADSPAKREWKVHGRDRIVSCDLDKACSIQPHRRVVDAEWVEKEIERLDTALHNMTLANSENKRLAAEAQAAAAQKKCDEGLYGAALQVVLEKVEALIERHKEAPWVGFVRAALASPGPRPEEK